MNNQPCKSRKVNIISAKIHAAKCVIQSFPNLITENLMRTIIAYRRLIEDEDDQRSLKWIINCKLVFNYHYASYFYKKVA